MRELSPERVDSYSCLKLYSNKYSLCDSQLNVKRVSNTRTQTNDRRSPMSLFSSLSVILKIAIITAFLLHAGVEAQILRGKPPLFTDSAWTDTFPRLTQIVQGQPFHISCPTSSENVDIRWLKDGSPFEQRSRDLLITSVSPEDSGSYRCLVANPFGKVLSQESKLHVEYLHDFEPVADREISAPRGEPIVIRRPGLIASEGLPVQYAWYRNENEIASNSTFYVTADGNLILLGDFGHSGRYRVTASADGIGEAASDEFAVAEGFAGEHESPAFSVIYGPSDSSYVTSDPNSPLVMDCVPSFSDGADVKWLVDNVQLNENSPGVTFDFQQRRLSVSPASPLLKKKDSILVECRVSAASGRVFDERRATIQILSIPRLNLLPSELVKEEGTPIQLRCSVKENRQETKIQWWHDGKQIDSVNGALAIRTLKQEDFGVYQCEAVNKAGASIITTWLHEGPAQSSEGSSAGLWGFPDTSVENFRADDNSLPKEAPKVKVSPANTVQRVGEKAVFTCEVTGNPSPKIAWKFRGELVHGESTKYDVRGGRLYISSLKSSDSGDYLCEAENEEGAAFGNGRLTVTGLTLIENGPSNQSILIGTNIEIPCEVGVDLGERPEIQWSLNDEMIPSEGWPALRIIRTQKGGLLIKQVGPDNIGEYRCTVRVSGSEESQSAWLKIIEKPSMPIAVKAVLVNDTVPAKIRLSWREGFDGNSPLIRHSIEMRTFGPTTEQWGVWETKEDSIPPEKCCSVLIEDLKPSVTAQFRVIASNRYGAGIPSQHSQNITMPQQPPAAAPKSVAASARSSSSIMVQWQAPPSEQWNGDILGYMVRYRLEGYSLPWNEKNVTESQKRNEVIGPLITWRNYEIQVAAYNHRGLGVFSKSIFVTTLEGVPTQAPKRVHGEVLNSTAVRVTFTAPDQQRIPGVNLGYKVQFFTVGNKLSKEVLVDPISDSLTVIVIGLQKWGHYNLSVLCYTSAGYGPSSEPQLIVTEEDVPGAVADLSIDQELVMADSAVIVWTSPIEPNGDIVSYEFRYWRADMPDERTTMSLPGTSRNVTLEGLTPSTKYGVDIRAATRVGSGPWQETRFESGVPPELPGRPSSLSITDIEPRSVQLHFVPGFDGHTIIRQWIVEARMGDSSIFQTVYNISAPKARSFVVERLRPYTKYQLRLIAENVKGRGAPSEPTRLFQTLETNPDAPPSRLWVEPVSATGLVLSWTPLQHWQWNGQPKGYLVSYRQKDTEHWREVRTASLRATEFTLRELRPFTEYEVDLFAENVFGRSTSTGVSVSKTYESAPSGAPTDVRATSDGQRAVSVSWKKVDEELQNGDILGYKVRLVPEQANIRDEFEAIEEVVGEDQLQTKVSNLRSFTSYHVFVSAHTIVGSGPENTTPTIVQTGEDLPSEPSSVGFVLVSDDEVKLKWLPPDMPNGKIKAYTVTYWRMDEDRSSAITVPIGPSIYTFPAVGLTPNAKYRFTVLAENELGAGPEAVVDVITTSLRLPMPNPPLPQKDERKAFSAREISITWPDLRQSDDDAPIRFVQLDYQKANDDEWTPHSDSIPATMNRVTVTRLQPNTAYRFRIRLRGDFSVSSWSAESAWIKTMPTRPEAPPTQLSAAPYESNGLLLQWTAPNRSEWNSDVLGYKVSYRVYPSNESWMTEEIAPQHDVDQRAQTVIRNLRSFSHYIVNMRSLNMEGVSEASPPVFVYVGYSIPRGNVSALTAEPNSSTSIVLRWDAWNKKDDVISGFKVRYAPLVSVLSPESKEEQMVIVENNTAVITDLMKYTQYQISVSPYNRAGEGGMAVVRETTLEDVPGPVGELVFSDVLLDSVNVSWTPPSQPNGRIVRYIVNYNTYKLHDEFLKNIKQPTQMNFIVATGLEEGATYYLSVHAETSAGAGPDVTANITVGPSDEGPVPPTRPGVVPGHTSVTLRWTDGTVNARDVIGHLVQAKRVANFDPSIAPSVATESRHKRSVYDPPAHRMGEWVTLSNLVGKSTQYEISYRDLHPSSYYVFRVFARNTRGVGHPSAESEQLFVPASLPEDPFYTKLWFIALVAMATLVVIVCVVAVLCVSGTSSKEKRRRSVDSLQLADGNLAAFQLKQSGDSRITRSRNDLLTRPGTTTSWISDRDPPAYGSVLGDRNGLGVNMYGQLATDVIPNQHEATAMHRLSVLAGRDVRGSAYASSLPPTHHSHSVTSPTRAHSDQMSDGFDSFDDEEDEVEERGAGAQQQGDIAGHYAHSDHYSATWHRVRNSEASVRVGVPPPPLHRPPRPESQGTTNSGSENSWPSQPAPALEKGFSSFV